MKFTEIRHLNVQSKQGQTVHKTALGAVRKRGRDREREMERYRIKGTDNALHLIQNTIVCAKLYF